MRSRIKVVTFLAAGFTLLLTALVLSRQAATAMGQEAAQGDNSSSTMSMGKMMKQCRQHCQAGTAVMDRMSQVMSKLSEDASDPAKVRADLDEMQKQMKSLSENMNMCMKRMNMQGGMMDSSGGGMGHMMCGRK